MRDEQYLALAKAIKRPMRRWWLRVGSWWLSGAAALLLVSSLEIIYKNWHFQNIQNSRLYSILSYYNIPEGHLWIIHALSLAAAILCCQKIVGLISELTESTPMQSCNVVFAQTFKLSIAYCWPLLIPIVIQLVVFQLWPVNPSSKWLINILIGIIAGLEQATYSAIILLILIALTVLRPAPKWVPWLIYYCMIVSVGLHQSVTYCFFRVLSMFPSFVEIDLRETLTPLGFSLLYLLCNSVIYLIVYLYCLGKTKPATWLVSLVCLHIVLFGINGSFGIYPLDVFLRCGNYVESLRPVWVFFIEPKSELSIYVFGFTLKFTKTWEYSILIPLMTSFWLAVHYKLLSWIIRKVKPLAST